MQSFCQETKDKKIEFRLNCLEHIVSIIQFVAGIQRALMKEVHLQLHLKSFSRERCPV